MNKAKSLITGEGQPLNEDPGAMPPGGQPPMRRRLPPGGLHQQPMGGGRPGMEEPQGMLSRSERATMKDLVLLDLLTAMGGDPFYKSLVDMAIKGTDPNPSMVRHFMDEAPKFAKEMSPQVNELMGKLFNLPKQ